MSEAYIIEWDDSGDAPICVGPFPDQPTAQAFGDRHAMGQMAQNGQGGYSGFFVVTPEMCDYTPEKYAAEYEEADG